MPSGGCAVCSVMAQCVYTANLALTAGDNRVLMGQGACVCVCVCVSAAGPEHDSSSVSNTSKSPALSGRPKHWLTGLLEERRE